MESMLPDTVAYGMAPTMRGFIYSIYAKQDVTLLHGGFVSLGDQIVVLLGTASPNAVIWGDLLARTTGWRQKK